MIEESAGSVLVQVEHRGDYRIRQIGVPYMDFRVRLVSRGSRMGNRRFLHALRVLQLSAARTGKKIARRLFSGAVGAVHVSRRTRDGFGHSAVGLCNGNLQRLWRDRNLR